MTGRRISPEDFAEAVMASFSAYWAGRTEVAWPNVAYVPSSDSARESGFVRLVITGTGGEQVDLGRRRFRRFGLGGRNCLGQRRRAAACRRKLRGRPGFHRPGARAAAEQ